MASLTFEFRGFILPLFKKLEKLYFSLLWMISFLYLENIFEKYKNIP
jgi:hypothetical protein